MASYEVLSCEKVRTKATDYGPKKVLQMTLRNAEGTEKEVEWFTSEQTKEPAVGETIEGEVSNGAYGLNFKKPKPGGGGGGGRSPAENKKIVRQHSQEMALMREANLIARGHAAFTDEQLRQTIDWFEGDVSGKVVKGVEIGPMTSDVPADTSDLPIS